MFRDAYTQLERRKHKLVDIRLSPPKHAFCEYDKYEWWWFVTPEICVLWVHIQREWHLTYVLCTSTGTITVTTASLHKIFTPFLCTSSLETIVHR